MRLLAMRVAALFVLGVSLLGLAGPAAAQTPQTGWWYSPTEGGRGYAIETRNGRVFLAALMFNTATAPIWYLGQGPLSSGSLVSDLEFYGSGTNIFFSYSAAQRLGATATQATFTSSSAGTIRFLDVASNNTSTIQRFEFASGGLTTGAAAGLPESGWWWAPSESGVGYFIEFQGNSYYLGVMHYANSSFAEDAATPGQALWDVASGTMTSSTLISGASLVRYRNGQTLGGTYRAPSVNRTVATLNLQFTSTTTATLTVSPGGKTLSLERFRF